MKPTLLVPPAQAEALYDTLQSAPADSRRTAGQDWPQSWRDDDGADEPFPVRPPAHLPVRPAARRRAPSIAQAQ